MNHKKFTFEFHRLKLMMNWAARSKDQSLKVQHYKKAAEICVYLETYCNEVLSSDDAFLKKFKATRDIVFKYLDEYDK